MRNASVRLLSLVSVFFALHAHAQVVLSGATDREPIFIAATDLLTDSGEFASAVPETWRQRIESSHVFGQAIRRRAQPPIRANASTIEPCGGMYLSEMDAEHLVDRSNPESAIRNAKAIFIGTIDRATPGLFMASPASLLRLVDVVAVKTGPEYARVRDTVFVRHPHAHFSINGREHCSETGTNAYAPTAGDRVLVFAFDDPVDDQGLVVPSTAGDLIIEPATGPWQVPKELGFFANEGSFLKINARAKRILSRDPNGQERQ